MESRATFRQFNRAMVAIWRAGLGPLINATHPTTGRIMILGTLGRSSGRTRWTPVNYSPGEGFVWCTAGFGSASDWLRNLEAHPQVEVWLPQGRWRGQAEVVTEEAEVLLGLRRVLGDSGFAARLFAHIDPANISDDELRQQTRDYRLVRIQLDQAVDPGPRFPWQAGLAAGLAVGYWLGRRLSKSVLGVEADPIGQGVARLSRGCGTGC